MTIDDQISESEESSAEAANFAIGLRDALRAAQISQLALSERMGVSPTTVSRWLAGRMFPKRSLLPKLQGILPPDFAWVTLKVPMLTRRRPVAQREVLQEIVALMTPDQLRSIVLKMLLGQSISPKIAAGVVEA